MLVTVVEGHVAGNAIGNGVLDLFTEPVGETFQEENGKNVVLVVGGVDLTAQDVGSLPQLRFQLLSA